MPPWVQVTNTLRERIESGELAPGAMVPSIVAIHQEFGVAKTTARKVLAQLREEGLIVTTPGWGSFVRERGLAPPSCWQRCRRTTAASRRPPRRSSSASPGRGPRPARRAATGHRAGLRSGAPGGAAR